MDEEHKGRGRVAARRLGVVGLVVAGAVGGAVLATTASASADSTTSPSAPSPSSSSSSSANRTGPTGTGPARGDEKAVSSADEATLRAAALKAVPGGKVDRIETDSGDASYEAHMTKAEGTKVTVKFDKSLAVTAVEDGMGT